MPKYKPASMKWFQQSKIVVVCMAESMKSFHDCENSCSCNALKGFAIKGL